jgi:hypothetical protein
METICFLPLFALFLIIGAFSRNHTDDAIPLNWADDDQQLMEDIILLDKMDDDDAW